MDELVFFFFIFYANSILTQKRNVRFIRFCIFCTSKVVSKVSRTSVTHKVATVLIFLHSNKVYRKQLFLSSAAFYSSKHKLFALNEGQKRRKNTHTHKTFINKNRLLNERESSPKSSIHEIISLWIKSITILELLYISIAVHHFLF